MDYSQKKGFSSGFEQGVKIGSSGAEKRLDMIAKTKEKEQELADKIKGQERIAQFIESEMGNKSGADFIRSLPTAEVSTGIGLLLKSKGEEPSLAEKILAKQYGLDIDTTTGNIGNASLTAAVSSQNKGVSSTAPSQVEPSAETSTVPDMRIESVTAGGVTMKPVKTEKEKQEELLQKQAEANIETQKQIATKSGKEKEQLQRDYLRVQSVIDTTMDSAFRFGERQLEITGTKPGALLGIIDKMTPKQFNEYKAGWEGAGREASGTVGRYLIPGARGVALTSIFSKSTAEVGNTIEGNAFNVANTKGNLFKTAIANNVMELDQNGNMVPIQSITIDPITGKTLDKLSSNQKVIAINALSEQFVSEMQRHILTQAFIRNPGLLQQRTVTQLKDSAVNVKSLDEAHELVAQGKIMPGTLIKVKGRLGVSR